MIYKINELLNTPSDRKIFLSGRTAQTAEGITFFWTGSSLEFAVSGSELSVEVDVPASSLCPWICIYLNGHLLQRCLLRRGSQTLVVYDHLNYRETKHIRIIKDSPALLQNADFEGESLYTVNAIRTDGIFSPLPEKAMKIELIGDSITSGEGLFGYPGLITEDLWFFTAQPDLHYGMQIAERLNADLRIVTEAGWGVYIGYINDPGYNIPSIYGQVCGVMNSPAARSLGAQAPYDFCAWQPDLIIVNLGTNDAAAFSNPEHVDPATGKIFKMRTLADGTFNGEDLDSIRSAAISFLKVLRSNNPKARIIWCYGMMGHEIESTLMEAVHIFGDPDVSYVSLPDTLEGEFGSVDHPGIPSHKKTADTLAAAISEIGGTSHG